MKILEIQPTEESPYIIEDYPYGYTQRTQMKVWVETTKRGQRTVRQTLNPRTQKWNKPKKSTYSNIFLAGLNDEGHVKFVGVSMYSFERMKAFNDKYSAFFSDWQRDEMTNMLKMNEVYEKVTWTIRARKFKHLLTGEITESVPIFQMNEYIEVDDDGNAVDRKAEEKQQAELNRKINGAAVSNAAKATTFDSALATFKR